MSSDELAPLIEQLKRIVPYFQDMRQLMAQYRDQLKRYADVAEMAESNYKNQQALEGVLREAIQELSNQLSDIETYILAIATNTQSNRRATGAINQIQTRQDIRQLQQLLEQEQSNLLGYELKIAQQGGEIGAELQLLHRRDKTRESIARITNELDKLL